MIQEAFLFRAPTDKNPSNIEELNEKLASGYRVISVTALNPDPNTQYGNRALVILEKGEL